MNRENRKSSLFILIGPGLLVAATGVGAGDLATASLTGSQLGTAVLWAVVVGAFLKLVLTEGLARWQLATGHVPVWYYMCRAEEKDLLIRYGDSYAEYMKRVSFWLPGTRYL